jgi:hypothetical protein
MHATETCLCCQAERTGFRQSSQAKLLLCKDVSGSTNALAEEFMLPVV